LLQNAAAAASDNPEAASNALTLYDYKQQQVNNQQDLLSTRNHTT
jgi:hypothetical protein